MPNALTAYSSGDETIVYMTADIVNTSIRTYRLRRSVTIAGRTESRYHLVIWIREPLDTSRKPHRYEIGYQGKTISTDTFDINNSIRLDEQILLENFNEANNLTINLINDRSDQVVNVKDSYVIVCLNAAKTNEEDKCWPKVENERVYCECSPKDQLFTLFFFLILWLIIIVVTAKPMISLLLDNQKKATDVALNVNCNPKNARYIYVIFLRLAKGSPDFDLHDVSVDIHFFVENDEPMGNAKTIAVQTKPTFGSQEILFDSVLVLWKTSILVR